MNKPEEVLKALPLEAVETLADLAGVNRDRAEQTIQLLGLGSRCLLIAQGLVSEQEADGAQRLRLTDEAYPVMLAAALQRSESAPLVEPRALLEAADDAVRAIEERVAHQALEPAQLEKSPDQSRLAGVLAAVGVAAAQLAAMPDMAVLLRGVVRQVVRGKEPYAVIETSADTTPTMVKQFLSYSGRDRRGNFLAEGEQVEFLPAAAASGQAIAVDIEPLEAEQPIRRSFRRALRL